MSSISQIQANQRNAQLSTGPKTVEGKAVSAMNALKTGLDAYTMVIVGEAYDDFALLQKDYFERWCPTTPEQRMLVDTLIASEWRLRRYLRVESHLWDDCMPDPQHHRDFNYLSQSLMKGDAFFDRVNRQIRIAQLSFHTALKSLQALKKEELAAAEAANTAPIDPPSPQPTETQSTSTPIGFVPQNPSQPAVNRTQTVPASDSCSSEVKKAAAKRPPHSDF